MNSGPHLAFLLAIHVYVPCNWHNSQGRITLKLHKTKTTLWAIGLGKDAEQCILNHVGSEFKLKNWIGSQIPGAKDLEREKPLVFWIPLDIWNTLSHAKQRLYKRYDSVHRVLLLESDNTIQDLEQALCAGFMQIFKLPLDKEAIESVLERATEMRNIYDDIYRMTQEIYLERELLARKNEHLSFINGLVSRAAASLDAVDIMQMAREELNKLFPVLMVQGVVWTHGGNNELETVLYIDKDTDYHAREQWVAYLSENATKLTSQPVSNYRITLLNNRNIHGETESVAPQQGRIAILPLNNGTRPFGCLAILAKEQLRLGRDQVELLHVAAKHLALALRNALLFNEAKTQAQFDGLTRLNNRDQFDIRLKEELQRHQRYHQKMSVIMLDLDHFKTINDNYGHQAGDHVLKELGMMLQEAVRSTDFAARYGGEEFMLVLPQTDANQAWGMAERIRLKIGKKAFVADGHVFHITASMGIATLNPEVPTTPDELVQRADQALYAAKAKGRNNVSIYRPVNNYEPVLMQA